MDDDQINFDQTGPNSWKVADDSVDAMENVLNEALKKAGFPSLDELRQEMG